MAISDPHLQGTDRVREVFARVRNGDLSVADLYADDAVVAYADDGRVVGREAIREFYRAAIEAIRPQPTVEAVMEAPPLYVVLVDVPSEDTHHRALDLFEVDDAGIRRLEIYHAEVGGGWAPSRRAPTTSSGTRGHISRG